MKNERDTFTGERTKRTWSNAAKKVLDILHIEHDGATKEYLIDGYPVSVELYELLSDPAYATTYAGSIGSHVDEFAGIKIDKLDTILIHHAGIFHNRDAYNLLIQRTGASEDWFWEVARHKYGDLVHVAD